MALLPTINTTDRILSMIQTRWAAILNPVLSIPMLSGNQLTGVALASGSNVINHLLDRNPQGWVLTDNQANAVVYRSAPFNNKTLTLTSSAATTVSIWVW